MFDFLLNVIIMGTAFHKHATTYKRESSTTNVHLCWCQGLGVKAKGQARVDHFPLPSDAKKSSGPSTTMFLKTISGRSHLLNRACPIVSLRGPAMGPITCNQCHADAALLPSNSVLVRQCLSPMILDQLAGNLCLQAL